MENRSHRKPFNGSALQLGFRPFFLCASGFAVVSMVVWAMLYLGALRSGDMPLPDFYWHAHQMIYGYAMAVIAGFLLTAVANWTGRKTPSGGKLFLIAAFWLAARVAWLPGVDAWQVAGLMDGLFSAGLLLGTVPPVIRSGQWRQAAVLSKLGILVAGNACCYLALAGVFPAGMDIGIYGGFYLVIGLVMTLARRVIPFFIERALPGPEKPRNHRVLDISSLVLFLVLFVSEVFLHQPLLSAGTALLLCLVNALRLAGWYVRGLWGNAMLWSLYLSQWAIASGFLLIAGSHLLGIPRSLAIHALAVGGIGLVTAGMMARVALGHTGRPVLSPPPGVRLIFLLLIATAAFRVVLPLLWPSAYTTWILLSSAGWAASFVLFFLIYLPILTGPRVES
jgi:uncharacterized protein involved in response to NO